MNFNKMLTFVSAIFAGIGALMVPNFGAELVDDEGTPLVKYDRAFAK